MEFSPAFFGSVLVYVISESIGLLLFQEFSVFQLRSGFVFVLCQQSPSPCPLTFFQQFLSFLCYVSSWSYLQKVTFFMCFVSCELRNITYRLVLELSFKTSSLSCVLLRSVLPSESYIFLCFKSCEVRNLPYRSSYMKKAHCRLFFLLPCVSLLWEVFILGVFRGM